MSGIYIHIPFCRQICHYCDFHHSASLSSQERMVDAICGELQARQGYIEQHSPRTLYFGGGTPSVCSPEQIARMVDLCKELWSVASFDEVTLEANPEDLTPSYLEALRSAGIDRLSIGVQSFVDDHLRLMNRRHSAARAEEAVADARRAGFDNITVDLIYGMPFLSVVELNDNLRKACDLGVEHLSAYHLTIEPRTVFGKRALEPVPDDMSQLHFEIVHSMLIDAGYEHYEVSNFAREGFRARHNSGYWSGMHYIGVGPSAHSFDGVSRQWNVSSNKLYLEGVMAETELLSDQDRSHEYIMTRLRRADGIDLNEFGATFGGEMLSELKANARRFEVSGDLLVSGGRMAIPSARFLISDYIISELF